uniref:Uncharacterized protein n=1 Tax=Anguilla anguilla TaxID=7936 RepID=A0A0E9SP68_ANGAN
MVSGYIMGLQRLLLQDDLGNSGLNLTAIIQYVNCKIFSFLCLAADIHIMGPYR